MSNRNLSLDSDVAVFRRSATTLAPEALVDADVHYGIEVLKPEGWVPVAGLFTRRVREFDSMNDAVEACIKYWERSGRAARPFKVTQAA